MRLGFAIPFGVSSGCFFRPKTSVLFLGQLFQACQELLSETRAVLRIELQRFAFEFVDTHADDSNHFARDFARGNPKLPNTSLRHPKKSPAIVELTGLHGGFQDCRLRPLGHSSESDST